MVGGASKWRRAAGRLGFFSSCFSFLYRPKSIAFFEEEKEGDNAPESKKKADQVSSAFPDMSVCAICLEALAGRGAGEDPAGVFTAQCSHSFHFLCIGSNIRHGNVTCPICRARWPEIPRELKPPPRRQSDPVLRILDDSIATSRVNRRSSVHTARYNDDDPTEPAALTAAADSRPCLQLTLIPAAPFRHLCQFTSPSALGTRAYLSVRLAPQLPTDLVLVASPNGPHTRLMRQCMALVVFSLRAVDRLAVVTCSTSATRAFPLRRMTSHGKRLALQVIDRICYMGAADPSDGLQKGCKILSDRTHRNPTASILHLSEKVIHSGPVCELDIVPFPLHHFHIGFGFGMSDGFVMYEFEEFLGRLLGGILTDIQLSMDEAGGIVRLGELRGGEERRIPIDMAADREFIIVSYSYIESGRNMQLRRGEAVVGFGEKGERVDTSSGGEETRRRRSFIERWEYVDPFMARRWARHLHGCRQQ